jgi:chromosome segregation ATPase
MTELDSLFKLDGGIEDLDRTVHEKKAAVNTQTRELEALEARLRATEERLNQAKGNSPPSKTDNQQKAHQTESQPQMPESPLAQKTLNMPGALPQTPTPSSTTSADYVLVERPSSSKPEAA